MSRLILASGSPRRRQLLQLAGFDLDDIVPPDIPEVRDPTETPMQYVRRLAKQKAQAVDAEAAWILAADTIVHLGNDIFEKPIDNADSQRMMQALSGTWHKVTTAWCIRWSGGIPCPAHKRILRGHRTSRVLLRELTDIEIHRYIATKDGHGKAGGYAIQGEGAGLIDRVVGSTTNVVGLPLDMLVPHMLSLGIERSRQ